MRCPCGTGLPYGECCELLHLGTPAPTAERLMRSRFSAFAVNLPDYLLETWHPSTRPTELDLDSDVRWYRLDIESRERGGMLDNGGLVTFTAWFRSTDGPGSLHETSRFAREGGAWRYVDGIVDTRR
ncbi:YchJ family protein [Antiquaquibacter oligotrophicus]|nr:YchJ family protein [Antiquaquibacter oligotrophicus]UDF13440.1 YchJ family protein [Antiquaquibacter oligotrophicus]